MSSESQNPYAAPSVDAQGTMQASSKTYGGIGRLKYLAYAILSGIVANVLLFGGAAIVGKATVLLVAVFLLQLVVGVTLVALRLTNLGYNPWLCLGLVVPVLNLLLAVAVVACPAGYADHRKLDTAAKIIFGIVFVTFLVVVLVSLAAIGS